MHQLLALTALLMLSPSLLANDSDRLREANFPERVHQAQATLELKNQAVLTYLWVDVYAAAFYSEPQIDPRQALQERHSKRLTLYYFRDIDREDVIEAAWITLRRQQPDSLLAKLRYELDALHASFRDIRAGDRYSLDYHPQSGLQLIRNGARLFTSKDPQLATAYLAIWLAPQGLSDELRSQLLAEDRPEESRP
ncbi:chalcone isomerase family protein [Pseudomonas zhanjiangensis]|uniref:Chalcone isomerase family protein n=1 Tax=Pseudomonas zhanjiangensis TaxID=3239015 RepID=A0ABV3YVV5_9PSED